MLRRIFHTICSLWLAMLLLFGSSPMEAIHAFADHHDTVHHHDNRGPVIDQQHHHCSFLGFQLMPFDTPPQLPLLRPAPALEYPVFAARQDERATQQEVALRDSRGPPSGTTV
jgi:hypothetical protein